MSKDLIYLGTYILQQDMRIRLPKSILENMPIKKGVTKFAVYFNNRKKEELILRITHDSKGVIN